MVANSWMQTPAGGVFKEGRFALTNSLDSIFNPDAFWAFSHMWIACLEITIFVLGGISAWYLVKGRHVDFFLRTFKFALAAALVIMPLQIWLGDGSGREVAETQPTKLAGIEAHCGRPTGLARLLLGTLWPGPTRTNRGSQLITGRSGRDVVSSVRGSLFVAVCSLSPFPAPHPLEGSRDSRLYSNPLPWPLPPGEGKRDRWRV
jgi:hypothetical protein